MSRALMRFPTTSTYSWVLDVVFRARADWGAQRFEV